MCIIIICKTDLQILKQPESNIFCEYHKRVVLSVSAVGYETLCYEWKKDGDDINYSECTGTETNMLTIINFSHKHQGTYICVVDDGQKFAKSEPVNLILGMN